MARETEEVVVTGTPVRRREEKEVPMQQYKLRAGATHYMDGEAVQAGEEIGLTDSEYAAFADKFESVDKKGPRRASKGKLAKGVEDVDLPGEGDELNAPPVTARGVSHTPQDIGGKTPDLDAPQANPGNATRGKGANTVAGGVPVSAASLQSSGKAVKEESKPGKDGPVNEGQVQPHRDSNEAALAGGVGQAAANEAARTAAGADDKTKDKK